jgi:hypothetical protein
MAEILRYYYNQADVNERSRKDFKFPVIFPIVFYSGKDTWTVPFNFKDVFANAETFGNHVLNFEYILVDAKGYTSKDVQNFSSKLLGTILLLEKAKNDIEFFSIIRDNLDKIEYFDTEEKRILTACIKLLDVAYHYQKGESIKELLNQNNIQEVDGMLSDLLENAQLEREQLFEQGIVKGANRFAQLNKVLLKDKRYDLLEKISEDEQFRNELYVKYNL